MPPCVSDLLAGRYGPTSELFGQMGKIVSSYLLVSPIPGCHEVGQ